MKNTKYRSEDINALSAFTRTIEDQIVFINDLLRTTDFDMIGIAGKLNKIEKSVVTAKKLATMTKPL